VRALVLALAVLVLVPAAAPAQGVIVRFRMAADAADRATVRADAGVRRGVALPLTGAELVEPRPGVTVAEAVATLEASRAVLYAEPDAPRRALLTPDDPLFRQQWALENTGQVVEGAAGLAGADVRATAAWDRTTGSPSVTVAVVDSGVDAAHPDLAPNLLPGADLVEDDATPQDEDGHGTHVAGTIGARGGDGLGIAGVAWRTRLLPLRVLDGQGAGSVSDAIRAYARAAFAGARVVNLSFGGAAPSRAERDAIAALPGLLFVAAAGNEGADLDRAASYPCEYELEHVLCVAATDPRDALAPWSDFGATGVDLAAPGVSVLSTWPGRRHAVLSGTSMAAPHVAGAAALHLEANPEATPGEVRDALVRAATEDVVTRTLTGTPDRLLYAAPVELPAPAPAAG
jgi:subtilisin family serine protease